MLEFGDGIPKTPLIWMHTLMCLVHFAVPGSLSKMDAHWSRILQLRLFHVHLDDLCCSFFEQPNTVHCMFQAGFDFIRFRAGYQQPSSLVHVGSTAVARTAKMKSKKWSNFWLTRFGTLDFRPSRPCRSDRRRSSH